MKKIIALMIAIGAQPALAQGVGRPAGASAAAPWSLATVVPAETALKSMAVWNGSTLIESRGVAWTMAGTVPQVAAGARPAGAGPFTNSAYYDAGNVLNPSGSFTACALINHTSSANQDYLVKDGAGHRTFQLYFGGGNAALYVYKAGGASSSASMSITSPAIHLVCGVYTYVGDGTSSVQMVVDGTAGTATTTAVGPPAAETGSLRLGENPYTGYESPAQDTIYLVAYWHRALSVSELQGLYQRTRVAALY